jgi:general nucleoside transport system permease protein
VSGINASIGVEFIVAAITAGTALVYATLGELLGQRAGVMNLGVEGLILFGAVAAYWGLVSTGSLSIGVLVGMVAGALLASVHAFWAITIRANQIVSGLAIVIIGTGLATYLGSVGAEPLISRPAPATFRPIFPEGLRDLPIVGPILLGHDPLVYLSWAFAAATSLYLFRTRTGLAARSVGEDPASADAAGISVASFRYAHVLIGGAASGVAGAYLTLALFGAWQDNISAGTGWIAFALVIIAAWRPWRALFAAYIFGGLTSLGFNLQLIKVDVPLDVLSMLPFLATFLALVAVSSRRVARGVGAPAALAEPYWREHR